jgi:hypothetical protein
MRQNIVMVNSRDANKRDNFFEFAVKYVSVER